MTQKTVSSLAVLTLLREKAPVNWHTSWVAAYRLRHTPYQQSEEDVEADQQPDVGRGSQGNHVLIDEDEVVEDDEAQNPHEMGIEQPTTHET